MLKWSKRLGINAQDELKNIFHTIDNFSIISIANEKGDIIYVNNKFCDFFKYSKEELIGKNQYLLKSDHHPNQFYEELWNSISKGNIWMGKIKSCAKTGTSHWLFTIIVPFFHQDSESHQYISIQFTIPEEKMDKQRMSLNQAMIEREIRNQFLFTLGHDLKTPLTIAKMSAQIIEKRHTVTDKIKNLSCKITDNINRIDDMITNFLNANREKNSQYFPVNFTEFNIAEVILETLEKFSAIHGDRFRYEGRENFKGYWCLSGIKNILENLMTNALQYGNKQAPIIIKLNGCAEQLILSIHNEGKTISKTNQKIISDYLHPSSAQLNNPKELGRGLALVKAISLAHEGNIRFFSFPKNGGTTFTVTLPRDSRPFLKEKTKTNENLLLAHESENLLRLFHHMPEMIVILSGPQHIFEFVNEAHKAIFGINVIGMSWCQIGSHMKDHSKILDEIYSTGVTQQIKMDPINISGKIHYFNHTWVPRKNITGNIIGILSISSEMTVATS